MQNIDFADYLQRFTSKVLWHFTGYSKKDDDAFKILLSIVQNKLLKISGRVPIVKMPSKGDRWGYQCSCMCDIPFKDLRIHTCRYGGFGIAFHKTSAIRSGHFNPVLYMHKSHTYFQIAEDLIKKLETFCAADNKLDQTLENFLKLLGTYIKPGDLLSNIHFDIVKDQEQDNNFYYEREWRSAYDWNFRLEDVAAIMLPGQYIQRFRTQAKAFDAISIISTEMLEAL